MKPAQVPNVVLQTAVDADLFIHRSRWPRKCLLRTLQTLGSSHAVVVIQLYYLPGKCIPDSWRWWAHWNIYSLKDESLFLLF